MVPVTSSFGLGFPAAVNLIDGRDYSPEESRWDYYQARDSNKIPEYERKLTIRKQDMNNCVDHLRQNARKAARYTQLSTKAKQQDPNTSAKSFIPEPLNLSDTSQNSSSAFGSITGTTFGSQASNPFGPQSSNPFASQLTGSAFGSSSLGTTDGSSKLSGNSAFGSSGFSSISLGSKSSGGGAFGTQKTESAFGSSSLSSATSTNTSIISPFGSSNFGSSANKPSAFGSSGFGSLSTNTGSAFGSSGFGSTSTSVNKASPFGASSLGSTISSGSAFGSSGFSSGANTTMTPAFGSSGFTQKLATTTISPFSTSTSSTTNIKSPFGSTSQATALPFGQTTTTSISVFDQTANKTTSPFGQVSTTSNISPFGQSIASDVSPFGATTTAYNGFGSGNFNGFSNSANGEFTPTFKQSANEPPRAFKDDLLDEIKKEFESLVFQLGKIPEIPPPLAYC